MSSFEYDNIPEGYYDRVFRRRSGVQAKWHDLKFRQFKERLRPGDTLLDVGCGPGTFIGLIPQTVSAVGVDIAESQIDYPRRLYGTSSHQFSLVAPGELPLEANSFDVVTVIELIKHIAFDAAVSLLKDARRLLCADGRLLISTPNYRSLWPVLELLVNRLSEVSYDEQHITHYNVTLLRRLLHTAGFEPIQLCAYQFSAPFFASLSWSLADRVQRLEPPLFTRNLGFLLFAECRVSR
jgi:SAM-dependent methyltransferase